MADPYHLPQAVHHIAHIKPLIAPGVTYMTAIISSIVSALIGGGIGWYVKGRGMTGVKNDLANVKTDIEMIKNKISPPVISAPAV